MYFGVINLLKGTGDYGMANVIFLVIIIPVLSIGSFLKGLSLQKKIIQIK
jgi:hypothetical protein